MTLVDRIERAWWRPDVGVAAVLLAPAAAIFAVVSALRRALYRRGWFRRTRLAVPVVVIGNIAVGGTGKTPLTCALAEALRERGYHPGIVSRGYGRRGRAPQEVTSASPWREVGDEPLVLARSGLPVWVGAARAATAHALLTAHPAVDVILSDDGMQHYSLLRDVEIAVVDAARGFGNGLLLPAGPLREPVSRLASVDAIVERHAAPAPGDGPAVAGVPRYAMRYEAQAWRNVAGGSSQLDATSLAESEVVAIAGIANPESFFAEVEALGIRARTRAFPDHHCYRRDELAFAGARAILMTEKDAVKCREFGDVRMWFLPIRAVVDPGLADVIAEKLRGSEAARDARVPGHQGTAGA